MASFYESAACRSGSHCRTCRSQSEIGSSWRSRISKTWEVIGSVDFDCPYGNPWGYDPAPVVIPEPVVIVPPKILEPIVNKEVNPVVSHTPPVVHQQSGMVNVRSGPCSKLGDSLGTEEKKCCGGRVRLVEMFRCLAGVQNGKISRDVCISCGLYQQENS
jgi:hypothetical protein